LLKGNADCGNVIYMLGLIVGLVGLFGLKSLFCWLVWFEEFKQFEGFKGFLSLKFHLSGTNLQKCLKG
jgi:hypothetical protein